MRSVSDNITAPKARAVIPMDDIQKDLSLTIVPKSKDTLHQLSDPEEHSSEPEWQLFEGFYYDFALSCPTFTLSDKNGYGIVRPHSTQPHLGVISPNIYTGTLEIDVHRCNDAGTDEIPVGKVQLEIQSLKTGYRQDYRTMLEFITEKCTDLVMHSSAPTTHYFEPDYESEEEKQRALYQRFAFIKAVIDTDEFTEAVHRVVTRPVTRWSETQEPLDIRRVRHFSRSNIREITRAGNRMELPESHHLRTHAGLRYVPVRLTSSRKIDSYDTPENRFVKHALQTFLQFCTEIHDHASGSTGLRTEARNVMIRLESHLHHSLFRGISRVEALPLSSPVLQRKEGYRELLRTWLMFDLAAKLVWKGGDDVYGGRKKDVATLYEYWLFFQLLDVLETVFQISPKSFDELVEVSPQGLDIRLKQGRHVPLHGVYKNELRNLNIRFSYNRVFGGGVAFDSDRAAGAGSWTASMRPDYTLSMWPESLSESDAERNELMVHIHFDAKYKVENLFGLLPMESQQKNGALEIIPFDIDEMQWVDICRVLSDAGIVLDDREGRIRLKNGNLDNLDVRLDGLTIEQQKAIREEIESQFLSKEKQLQRGGTYRNADLLKMHAYKDAIRRTAGAYVLYPGFFDGLTPRPHLHRGFHEIVPGLGAFAVSPRDNTEGLQALRNFIRDVRNLFVNRISQREKMALHTRRVHRLRDSEEGLRLAAAVPEFLDDTDLLNADETWVLVGYYRTEDQLDWIRETGCYNFRADMRRRGALKMDSRTAGARYLLLHGPGEKESSKLYKLNGKGPRVSLRSQLLEEGYPDSGGGVGIGGDVDLRLDGGNSGIAGDGANDSSADAEYIYYIYDEIQPATDNEFKSITIDITKLPGYKPARSQRGYPLTVSLTELMSARV
jgi:predicted component of viral defense system (DUF524 family)